MFDTILDLYKDFLVHGYPVRQAGGFSLKDLLQVLLIIAVVIFIYFRYIKGTQSEKLVRGILFFITGVWVISSILIALNFNILGQIAQYLLAGLLFSMVIVFQPELRKILVHLGQTKFVGLNLFINKKNDEDIKKNTVKEITEAVKYCSRVKRGALIVIQKDTDESFYNEIGTAINSDISAELILTIFFPNTPLHDGAMVIHNNKILAAGVLLPLTEDPKLSWRYGTRHRAAIGASEISDSACIVVSEETGDISIAIDGILKKYDDITKFKEDLEKIFGYNPEEKPENAFMQNLFKMRKK